ncbi:hypothetical protein NCC49_001313 [Naganishia albida]|nr:hypothetical protein NCC49_001313 [Naganishia albida]
MQEESTEDNLLVQRLDTMRSNFQEVAVACGEVRCHLDPSEALRTLDESSTYIEREKRQRRAEVEKCQHELEELRELLAVAAQSALRPSNLPSIQQHEQELANLEADQITKGKSKNEIEAKIGAKEMELAGLKDEMRNVEEWNVEQDVTGLKPESHGSALRLVITREAGFKLISATDGQEKMQIRNDKKADVFYEPIQANVPRYDLTNKFWQAAGC